MSRAYVKTIMNVQAHLDRGTFSNIDGLGIIAIAVTQMANEAGRGEQYTRLMQRAMNAERNEFQAMGEYTANIRDYPNGAPGSVLA